MHFKHRFTVFTPCYNSETFIHRVFESLDKQTFKDFEWYVINDGSFDRTNELIIKYIKEVKFSVVYHNLQKNQGLHRNINQAIRDAKGEFLILLGHDDEMMPDALETFDYILKKYDDPEISAVYALAMDQNRKLVGKKYPKDEFVSDYWTQFFHYENEAEKFQCFRSSYLKEFYPLNTSQDKALPSAWLWGMLGTKYKAVFINKVLRIYYTNVPTSITNNQKRDQNPKMIFNYYQYWVNVFQYYIRGNWRRRLRGIGGYVSYGILAGKSISEILAPIEKPENRLIVLAFLPIAVIYNWMNARSELAMR